MRTFRNLQSARGFTLLEILIALAITAVMVSGAVLAFGDGQRSELKLQSNKLFNLTRIAQEESITRGIELGLRIEDDGYYFMVFNNDQWQPLNDHRLLKPKEFNEPYVLSVHLDGQETLLNNAGEDGFGSIFDNSEEADEATEGSENLQNTAANERRSKRKVNPQIFMLSSGEMNEFTLTIGLDRDEPLFYRIKGDFSGKVVKSCSPIEGHPESDWDMQVDDEYCLEQKAKYADLYNNS